MDISLKITKEQMQGNVPVMVFHLRGWLDAQGEEILVAEAHTAHEAGARFLLLDLDEVNMLTSAGVRAMQKIHKLFTPGEENSQGSYVKMCSAPPQVYHVLNLTGILQNVPNYESLQAAVVSFKE
ncbi:MAG: STAS domain-containing protein [Chloroflexi bacterium]|nr:STAS domain-containing protein [Chloroflexota bacterium]